MFRAEVVAQEDIVVEAVEEEDKGSPFSVTTAKSLVILWKIAGKEKVKPIILKKKMMSSRKKLHCSWP